MVCDEAQNTVNKANRYLYRAVGATVGTAVSLYIVVNQDLGHGESHDEHAHSEKHEDHDEAEEEESEDKDESKDEGKDDSKDDGKDEDTKADKKDDKKEDKKEDKKDSKAPSDSDKACLPRLPVQLNIRTDSTTARPPQRGQEPERDLWKAAKPLQRRHQTLYRHQRKPR